MAGTQALSIQVKAATVQRLLTCSNLEAQPMIE
jgi:hypothetical protein